MDYLKVQNVTLNMTLGGETTIKKNMEAKYEDYQQFYEVMREITGIYLFPFISTFGIIGNIFIIIVYAKSKIYSTSFYLIALSTSDILKLLNDLAYFLVTVIRKWDANLGHQIFILLYSYTHYIFFLTALNTSWLVCAIAIDRYLTVVRQYFINQRKVIVSISSILVIAIVFAIPAPLFHTTLIKFDPVTNTSTSQIDDTVLGKSDFRNYYMFINGILKSVLPILLLIYLNYCILRVVYKNRIKSKNRKGKSNSRITIMLVTIVLTFMICVLPDSIMSMMQLGYANEGYFVRGIREITDLLMALNSSSTFPICLYFSVEFRIKFKELFRPTIDHNKTYLRGSDKLKTPVKGTANINNKPQIEIKQTNQFHGIREPLVQKKTEVDIV